MLSMISEKGLELKVVDGFKFKKARLIQKGQKWRCTENTCAVTLLTDPTGHTLLQISEKEHSHGRDDTLCRQFLSNSVKRKATDDVSAKPLKLMRREIQELPAEIRQSLHRDDLHRTLENAYRAKGSLLPKLPTNFEELHRALSEMDIKCTDGADFLLVNDTESNIVIFATAENLKFLCDVRTILMDGTFDACPSLFYQFFTIHGVKNGNYIPLAFCPLPDKNKASYRRALCHLVDKCRSIGYTFYPDEVIVDFEIGIHEAVRDIWHLIVIIGCRFHLTQAWFRNMGRNSVAGYWLRWTFGMPILPPDQIDDAFTDDLFENAPPAIHGFTDYLLETYVLENAKFPPSMWASNFKTDERTTNACESFHAKFIKLFNGAHPNIFTLITVLKELQEEVFIKIRSAESLPRKRWSKARKNIKEQMDAYIAEYKRGRQGPEERRLFVERVSTYYKK